MKPSVLAWTEEHGQDRRIIGNLTWRARSRDSHRWRPRTATGEQLWVIELPEESFSAERVPLP